MMVLYNLAFLIFGILYLPFFILKLRQAENPSVLLKERLGFYRPGKLTGKILWLHAVSVGEVMAVRKFVELFLAQYPGWSIALTTVTPTGQKIARQMESSRLEAHYFPFDFTWAHRNFLKVFCPSAIILTETEIWPNLLLEAEKSGIPVGVINARLSARSAKRYGKFPFIFEPLFRKLDFVMAQTEEDGARFAALGIPAGKIQVLGNVKYDNVPAAEQAGDKKFSEEWGIFPDDLVLIAGSTHPGEEEQLFESWTALRRKFSKLKMILAPRHIERSNSILAWVKKNSGTRAFLSSERPADGNYDVLVLDQMGILRLLYRTADVVFMGGSLVKHGGQNPIEPACFKKAVLCGPYFFNFQKVYETLFQNEGAVQAAGSREVCEILERLFSDTGVRRRMGENAFAAIERLRGASQRHLDRLSPFLSTEERKHNVISEKLFPQTGGRI